MANHLQTTASAVHKMDSRQRIERLAMEGLTKQCVAIKRRSSRALAALRKDLQQKPTSKCLQTHANRLVELESHLKDLEHELPDVRQTRAIPARYAANQQLQDQLIQHTLSMTLVENSLRLMRLLIGKACIDGKLFQHVSSACPSCGLKAQTSDVLFVHIPGEPWATESAECFFGEHSTDAYVGAPQPAPTNCFTISAFISLDEIERLNEMI